MLTLDLSVHPGRQTPLAERRWTRIPVTLNPDANLYLAIGASMAKSSRAKRNVRGTPTCSCLVLCDDVVISHARDKHQLLGIIGAVAVRELPGVVPPMVAYVRLSNVHADEKITVAFSNADDLDTTIWELEAVLVNRNDPLAVHTLVTRIPAFLVEKAGRYLVTAKHRGLPLTACPVIIAVPGMKGTE